MILTFLHDDILMIRAGEGEWRLRFTTADRGRFCLQHQVGMRLWDFLPTTKQDGRVNVKGTRIYSLAGRNGLG